MSHWRCVFPLNELRISGALQGAFIALAAGFALRNVPATATAAWWPYALFGYGFVAAVFPWLLGGYLEGEFRPALSLVLGVLVALPFWVAARWLAARLGLELATGLLHNTFPEANWLWTRWLWDPTTGTGILPLLAGSSHNLLATNIADGYARVGAVTAMSMKFAEGTGLWTDELMSNEKRALFANSAFLACAYAVYMYGSTSWRLSRDFNELLPSLPNMARRLLGLPKVKD